MREIDGKTTAVSQELLDVPEIAEAVMLTEESAYTPGELEFYASYWDQVSREKTLLSGFYRKGKAAGEVLGIQKVARKLKASGISFERIAEVTGLELEEIAAL